MDSFRKDGEEFEAVVVVRDLYSDEWRITERDVQRVENITDADIPSCLSSDLVRASAVQRAVDGASWRRDAFHSTGGRGRATRND